MPCVDHEFKNCPAYIELGDGEKCLVPGCQRQKAILETSGTSLDGASDDLEDVVIAGKTGGRQGTI
jgi:hypothetical protein